MAFNDIKPGLRGEYSVCIYGSSGMSDNEVTNIFEKYGHITRPLKRVNELAFLGYETKEEAINCLYDMAKHPTLKVNPGKSRNRDNSSVRSDEKPDLRRKLSANSSGTESHGATIVEYNHRSMTKPPGKLRAVVPEPVQSKDLPLTQRVVLTNIHPDISEQQITYLCSKAGGTPQYIDIKTFQPKGYPKVRCAIVHVGSQEEVNLIATGLNSLTLNGQQIGAKPIEQLIAEGRAAAAAT